jgi:hypothetical protein
MVWIGHSSDVGVVRTSDAYRDGILMTIRVCKPFVALFALPFFACDCDVAALGEYGPPGKIAGVVCDEATGFPVEDRAVRFESDVADVTRGGTTDAWGAFVIEDAPAGPGRLAIQTGATARFQDIEVIEADTTFFHDSACRPGAAVGGRGDLVGTICNRHVGDLVSNADVTVALPDGTSLQTTTDESGHFEMADIPAGERIVNVFAPGYQRSFLVAIEAGKTATLDVGDNCQPNTGDLGTVSGSFCDPTYAGPLAGADVTVIDPVGEEHHDVTDLDGWFLLGPMPPGAVEVHMVREPDVDETFNTTIVAGQDALLEPGWACGNGGGNTPPPGGGFGPPGDLKGRVCAPDGETWLAGAEVWVEADGRRSSATTDGDGSWYLADVPSGTHTLHIEKGSFSTTLEVVVEEGVVVEMPDDQCEIGQDDILIAVVDGAYDDVYSVLINVGVDSGIIDRYEFGWADSLLGNYDTLATYDIVLINCGAEEYDFTSSSIYADNLRQYVQNGGSVYASDWAYDIVELMFPSHIEFTGDDYTRDAAQTGAAMDQVLANITDLGLSQAMGQSYVEIHYALAAWAVMESVSSQVTVYLRADADTGDIFSTSSTLYDVPHTVGFSHGQGKVIYTSFHQEPGLNLDAERLLQLLVFEL